MITKLKSINPISLNIIVGTLFSRMAVFMTIPFLAIYLTTVKDISAPLTGAIIGISSLVSLFGGFIGGHLADRYGREVVMFVSIFAWVFVFVGFAVAEHVFFFFILNAMNGLCRSFFDPASRAMLSDITKQENKLLVFNMRYAAINVGAAIGPLIGLKMGAASSTSAFYVTAIVYFIYGVSLILTLKKHPVQQVIFVNNTSRTTFIQACSVLKKDSIFLLAIIGFSLGMAGYSQFSSTIPQYLAEAPIFENGIAIYSYLIVLNAITVLLVQYPVSRIGKYFSPLFSIMLGTLTVSIGLIGFGISDEILFMCLSMIIFTIGEVMMFTMTDLFVDQIAPPNMRGLYFGAMGFTAIGGAFGPWIGGLLLSYLGYTEHITIFALLAILSAFAFPILLYVSFLVRATKKNLEYSL